jgi:DNA-binding CsgD family transcriptional regulator
MNRVSHGMLGRIQRFLLEVHSIESPEELRTAIPRGAARLIASDRANFNEFDVCGQRRLVVPAPVPAYWKKLGPVLLAHMHEHPLGNPAYPPPWHRAGTFEDPPYGRQWAKSTLYHEYYLPAGIRDQLLVPILQRGSMRYSLAFNRASGRFAPEERAALEFVSPHIALALRRTARGAELRAGGTACRSLTRREREVLHWLGEGKRNAEIAAILGLSSRTVSTHVEHILEKLGVETRTAAARIAFASALR